MPSAKSHRAQSKRAIRNKTVRSFTRSRVVKARDVVAAGEPSDESAALVKDAISALDRAARKGIIHRNEAARKKSSLQRKLNALASS